jgi:hypothetical protein
MRSFLTSIRFLAVFIIAIFIAHTLVLYLHWYSKFLWLDAFFHFLGGFWLAAAIFHWGKKYTGLLSESRWILILAVVSLVSLIGVFWEFFEFGADMLFGLQNSPWRQQYGLADTLSDLFWDLIGGLLAAFLITRNSNSAGRR